MPHRLRLDATCLILPALIALASGIGMAHDVSPDTLRINGIGKSQTFTITDPTGCTANMTITSDDPGVASVLPGSVTHSVKQVCVVTSVRAGATQIQLHFLGDSIPFCVEDGHRTVYVFVTDTLPRPPITVANLPNSASTAEPINTATGELFFSEEADLVLGGPLPVFFSRYYAALIQRDGYARSTLGNNWLHNYEMSLNVYKDTATVVSNHGRVIQFRRAGANWQLKGIGETPYQLDSVGGRYRLFDPMNEYTYLFGALGVLERIEDGKGNSIVLTYSFGQLRQVSDGIGRTLTFTYNLSGFLASVSDGTRSVTFTQDANRNLASVTGVMGGTNTYTYQVGAIAGLLLYETYPRGNVHYRQQYDASGRVISQTDAIGGVRRLTYVVGSTTIIDPYGNAIVHHYDAANNLTGFDDEAHRSVSCGLDASGVRNTLTDRLGGVTMLGHRGVFLD